MLKLKRSSRLMAVVIVLFAVLLNVMSGIVLKSMTQRQDWATFYFILSLGAVLAINGLRFAVWAVAHRNYNLSLTYPLSSIFFPLMLAVSYFYREPVNWNQWLGTFIITVGVIWLARTMPDA